MNPRYPTSKQFRRHRNRKLGRPLLVLGLMAGVVLYWIFSSVPAPRKPEVATAAESKALEEEIAAHLKGTQPALTPATAETPHKEKGSPGPEVKADGGRKLAVIDPPSLTDPTARLDGPESPFPAEPVGMAALVPSQKPVTPVAVPAKKPQDGSRSSDTPKSKSGDSAKGGEIRETRESVKETKEPKEVKESEDSVMPSAPKELAPKAKPPDLDMTFYRELAKRKVVVPVEESLDGATAKQATPADPAQQRPGANPEKSGNRSGNYVVQLAVFSDAQRAATMVADLHKRGVPARVVKSKDGNQFRVRLGPFPSHTEAVRSVAQWKLGGQSTLIFQDNEG